MPYRRSRKKFSGRKRKRSYSPRKGKRGSSLSKKVARISKRLKSVEQVADNVTSTQTYRISNFFPLTSEVGVSGLPPYTGGALIGKMDINSCVEIENGMARMRFFDEFAPQAPVNVDWTSATMQNTLRVNRSMLKCTFRANYNSDVHLELWEASVLSDTNIDVVSMWDTSLVDMSYDVYNTTSPYEAKAANMLVYPSDCPNLTAIWKFKKICSKVIKVGSEYTATIYSDKGISYDTSLYDNHNVKYLKRYGAKSLVYRLRGCISHDSTDSSKVGWSKGAVDCYQVKTYEYEYSGDANLKMLQVTEGDDSFAALQTGDSGYPSVPTLTTYDA